MVCGCNRKVDVRLPGKGNSNAHGARPLHLIITMKKWIRTSRLSISLLWAHNASSAASLPKSIAYFGGGVQGSGCRVQGSWCRVQGSGCRVQGAGCRGLGLDLGTRVAPPEARREDGMQALRNVTASARDVTASARQQRTRHCQPQRQLCEGDAMRARIGKAASLDGATAHRGTSSLDPRPSSQTLNATAPPP